MHANRVETAAGLQVHSVWGGCALLLPLLMFCSGGARALDVEVDSQTHFSVYDVGAPSSPVVWSRRRMVEDLELQLVHPLGEPAHDGRQASLSGVVSLRFDNDFGTACLFADEVCHAATDSDARATYEPLASEGAIILPLAYVKAGQLPHGFELTVGRQLHWDLVGFARFDGAGALVKPTPWLAMRAMVGSHVDDASVAGSDAFVPSGIPRLDLEDQAAVESVGGEPPVTTILAGGSLELGLVELVRASLVYRKLLEPAGTVEHSGGLGLESQPVRSLRVDASTIFDLETADLASADAGLFVTTGPVVTRLTASRRQPRFDRNSIWAYFQTAPSWQAALGPRWDISSALSVGAAIRVRRLDLAQPEDDLGGQASISWQQARTELQLAGHGWGGEGGPEWGSDFFAGRRLLRWLSLEARLSAWGLQERDTRELSGTTYSESLGARIDLAATSEMHAELSHAHSGEAGHRFQFVTTLHVGAWR